MKSLQESLFDKDLVEKGVPIDFEALRDMLFDFGRRKAKLFDNAGVIYHEGKMSIYIKKFLGENDKVCFELEFGVTNVYPSGTAFNIPQLRAHDRFMGSQTWNSWKSSKADINATSRQMIKKLPELADEWAFRHCVEFRATDKSIPIMFDLYDRIIEQFCSKEFEKDLIKFTQKFEDKHEIPGIIMDILMKRLITKA